MDENFIGGCTDLAMVPPDMQHEQHSEDKFRLGKSERESRRGGRPHLPFAGCRQASSASCSAGGRQIPSCAKSARTSATVLGSQANMVAVCRGDLTQRNRRRQRRRHWFALRSFSQRGPWSLLGTFEGRGT